MLIFPTSFYYAKKQNEESEDTNGGVYMLTPKQELFCHNLEVRRLSQREAYMDAYPSSKTWKPSTIDEAACRLANSCKILARRQEIAKEEADRIAKEAAWTRQDSLKELKKLIDRANKEMDETASMSGPNVSAIINAVKELNGIFDVMTEKTEQGNDGFIEALNGQAREVWNDEENGDVPV